MEKRRFLKNTKLKKHISVSNIINKEKKSINPLITIITPVKNDVSNIKKTIKSVLRQNYKNFEYIIVDGASTDGTLEVIKNVIKNNKKKIKCVSTKDKNLWQAINRGIKLSSGDIIGIINSNDVYYKNALNIVKKYFNNFSLDFLFGAVKKKKIYHLFSPEKIFYRLNIYPSHSIGFFIKKKSQIKVGLYDDKLKLCADYDLFYRMIVTHKMFGMPTKKKEVLGKFNLYGLSSRIPFIINLYYEMLVRLKNGQNIFYLTILLSLRLFHKLFFVVKQKILSNFILPKKIFNND
jgi:glycosyltransferase involved in cell wall biosynthesis